MKTPITPKNGFLLFFLIFFGLNSIFAQESVRQLQTIPSTTWNGTSWSNGLPDAQTKAIFAADLVSEQTLVAESVEVAQNARVTFESGNNLIVTNAINVSPSAKLLFKENANLSQKNSNVVNTTLLMLTRQTPPITKFDYVYWSSPVQMQNIGDLSPNTLVDKYLQYSPSSGWQSVPPATTTMEIGKGYAIRGDQNFALLTPFDGVFNGAPNNGNQTTPIGVGSNLIGNPYPDALSADCFILDPNNQGILNGHLLFWTHNIPIDFTGGTPGNAQFNYNVNDLAAYNLTGGVGTGATVATSNQLSVNRPNGYVASGQGFVVQGLAIGSASFNNTMRSSDPNDDMQFFRASGNGSANSINTSLCPTTRHRIWIRMTNGTNFKETLLGYAPNATTSATLDRNYDLKSYSSAPIIDINTLAPVSQEKLTIQGRQLPAVFNVNDIVPLAVSCPSGVTAISATDFDGIFSTQNFWLREDNAGIISYYDIRTIPYTFNAVLNNNTTRFQIVFSLPATTNINSNLCNTTIPGIWDVFYFSGVAGVTTYHIMAVPTNNSLPTIQFNTNVPRFQIVPYGFSYNTSYKVFVATYQVGGQWVYNTTPCTFTTPASPNPSSIFSPACGSTLGNKWDPIRATTLEGMAVAPTSYQFIITVLGNTYTYTTGGSTFQLPSVPGLPIIAGSVYTISVNVNWNNTIIAGITTCNVTMSNTISPRQASNHNETFQAKAYPNPFANNFRLNVNSSGDEKIEFHVYDMLGRQIEARVMSVSESYSHEIGNNYASGVYNLVIKQNDDIKTIRIVKR